MYTRRQFNRLALAGLARHSAARSNARFGNITGTANNSPRQMQFAAKLLS